jgi:hypothetical protein
MYRRQPGTSGPFGDEIIDRRTRERLSAFGDEQPGERVGVDRHVALDRAKFIAGEGVFDGQSPLETLRSSSAGHSSFIKRNSFPG